MPAWVMCYKCGYWFLPDNDKKNYKVVQYQGTIIGAICSSCSGMDKKNVKQMDKCLIN